MAYRDVNALLARIASLEEERGRVRLRARRIARARRVRSLWRYGSAFVILALATTLYLHRRVPELTEGSVLQDLGKDELVLYFRTEPDDWVTAKSCSEPDSISKIDEEQHNAALAAGWIEHVCGDDLTRMRLTAEGRRRSSRWKNDAMPDSPLSRWRVTIARYERTAAPIVARGATPNDEDSRSPQRFVTIPGRYVPNDDGQRLYETGFQKIRAVDRVEKFTYWESRWARYHGGE